MILLYEKLIRCVRIKRYQFLFSDQSILQDIVEYAKVFFEGCVGYGALFSKIWKIFSFKCGSASKWFFKAWIISRSIGYPNKSTRLEKHRTKYFMSQNTSSHILRKLDMILWFYSDLHPKNGILSVDVHPWKAFRLYEEKR